METNAHFVAQLTASSRRATRPAARLSPFPSAWVGWVGPPLLLDLLLGRLHPLLWAYAGAPSRCIGLTFLTRFCRCKQQCSGICAKVVPPQHSHQSSEGGSRLTIGEGRRSSTGAPPRG